MAKNQTKKQNQKFLTQDWYNKLINELNELKNEKLPDILNRIKEAVSQWDISENAEYETAMWEKDLTEARIGEIENMLENVEIIEEWKKSTDIRYWSKVKVEDEKGKTYEITIVWSWEVDILEETISFESPMWIALQGKKKGDTIKVKAPHRRYTYKILDVR